MEVNVGLFIGTVFQSSCALGNHSRRLTLLIPAMHKVKDIWRSNRVVLSNVLSFIGYFSTASDTILYVGVLISLWLFIFSYLQHNKRIFLGWVKEVRTTKP
jgi:hypothetical protein